MTKAALLVVLVGVIVGNAPTPTAQVKGAAVTASTPHLSVRAALSDAEVLPGTKTSIVFDVTPKTHMHVYAPGGAYRAVVVRLSPQPLLKIHEVAYPKPQTYYFEPLKEQALVYSEPFQLVLDLTVGETPEQQGQLRSRSRLTLKGTLEYQACDDRLCYLPTSIPLEWNLKIKRKP